MDFCKDIFIDFSSNSHLHSHLLLLFNTEIIYLSHLENDLHSVAPLCVIFHAELSYSELQTKENYFLKLSHLHAVSQRIWINECLSMLGAENDAVGRLRCQEFCSLAKTKYLQGVASENTKLFFASAAVFSKLITFKEPVQQNVLKYKSGHFFQERTITK